MTTPQPTQPTVPALTDAQELEWLLYGQYDAPWERGLLDAIIDWGHREWVPGPEDVDTVDRSWLPVLALGHRALTYTTIFGEAYERACIKSAPFYNRWAGYWPAVDRFAEDAEFTYTHTFIRTGTPPRNTGINIYCTPTLRARLSDADYIHYLVRTLPLLLPFFLGTINIVIADRINWDLRIVSALDHPGPSPSSGAEPWPASPPP